MPNLHSRLLTTASVIIMTLLAFPSAAWSGVEVIENEGRLTRTGPKGPQRAIDGIEYVDTEASPRPSGRKLTDSGRRLTAGPTQPISVGLIGCPGCTSALNVLGGIYIEIEKPIRGRRKRISSRKQRHSRHHSRHNRHPLRTEN